MPKIEKLFAGIIANPKGVRFADACSAAVALGFVHKGGSGSHHAYARPCDAALLNFQNRNGYIPPYQARQLIGMIEKYGDQK